MIVTNSFGDETGQQRQFYRNRRVVILSIFLLGKTKKSQKSESWDTIGAKNAVKHDGMLDSNGLNDICKPWCSSHGGSQELPSVIFESMVSQSTDHIPN